MCGGSCSIYLSIHLYKVEYGGFLLFLFFSFALCSVGDGIGWDGMGWDRGGFVLLVLFLFFLSWLIIDRRPPTHPSTSEPSLMDAWKGQFVSRP